MFSLISQMPLMMAVAPSAGIPVFQFPAFFQLPSPVNVCAVDCTVIRPSASAGRIHCFVREKCVCVMVRLNIFWFVFI